MQDPITEENQGFDARQYPKIRCKHLPFFERVKCKTKRLATIIYRGFHASSYLKTIIIFLLIILMVNSYLIYKGHFDSDGLETDYKTAMTDGIYFTTTQFTTIGHGYMGPKTKIGKIITSIIHIMVLFISLKLATEFGFLNNAEKIMERNFKEGRSSSVMPIDMTEYKNNNNSIDEMLGKPVTLSPLNY